MFDPKTEVVELQSRLGRVGSIQAYDPWDSRRSVDDAKWWVSRIARLSHGLGEAEDYGAHFDRVVNQMKHESVLEFVPVLREDDRGFTCEALPEQSLRQNTKVIRDPMYWAEYWGDGARLCEELEEIRRDPPYQASAFLVEAPIFVARQWMRHRSFAYLEMSRRYTKGSRVAWEFYGDKYIGERSTVDDVVGTRARNLFWETVEEEYRRRLDAGWPQEIARGCMPVETLTKFWVAGFDRDWGAFLKLRDAAHAQAEVRTFASWIRTYLDSKKGLPHV